jgi:hypothetical protein
MATAILDAHRVTDILDAYLIDRDATAVRARLDIGNVAAGGIGGGLGQRGFHEFGPR